MWIDVIIPTKNEEKHIRECINALLSQDCHFLNIYIVDNGSSDKTVEIVKGFVDLNKNVHLIQGQSRTVAGLRNEGVAEGSGDLLCFLDGHSIVCENFFHEIIKSFKNNNNVAGFLGKISYKSKNELVDLYTKKFSSFVESRQYENFLSGDKDPLPWIPTGASVFLRKAFSQVSGFDTELSHLEDVDLSWRIVLSGYLLSYCPNAEAVHFDDSSYRNFCLKFFFYGKGNSDISKKYGFSCKFNFNFLKNRFSLPDIFYLMGSLWGELCSVMSFKIASSSIRQTRVLEQFRPIFTWRDDEDLQIPTHVIFWFRDEMQNEIAVLNLITKKRIILNSVANLIWTDLVKAYSREQVVLSLSKVFGETTENLGKDLDSFVADLVDQDLLRHFERR